MPGRAADQDERARHESAAEHAVELADAGAHARHRLGLDLGERDRPHRLARAPWPPGGRGRALLLDERVPLAAAGAAAVPLGALVPAGGAGEEGAGAGHPARLSARVDGFAPPAQDLFPSVCRRRLHRLGGAARATCGRRGVRGAGHRDQRPRRRAVRAHRGGRGARRRGRAARDLRLAGAPGAAAVARHPALHRDHPGDGRRRASAGGGAAGGGAAARGARARGPQRELRPARAAPGLRAGRDRLARTRRSLCTVQLARKFAPLARRRGLAPLAEGLGHRGRRGAPGAPRRAHLRARVLRALPAPVRARRHRGRRARHAPRAAAAPARRSPPSASPRPSARTCPRFPTTRACTCSATTAAGRCTWASRCPCARAREPTSAPPPAGPSAPRSWTTGPPTRSWARSCSRTGSSRSGSRPGNRKLKRTDRHVFLRCRLDIPYPVLEVARRPRRGPCRERGPARQQGARHRARRPAHLALPAAPLRPQAAPAREPVGLRADGPLRLALPRRPRPERLPAPARPRARRSSTGRSRAGACWARSTPRIAEASAEQRYERAAALLRRRGRIAWVLERLEGILRATHAAPRLDARPASRQGALRRVLDRARAARGLGPAARATPSWSSAPAPRWSGSAARSARRCRRRRWTSCGSSGAGSRSNEPHELPLDPAPDPGDLSSFVAAAA